MPKLLSSRKPSSRRPGGRMAQSRRSNPIRRSSPPLFTRASPCLKRSAGWCLATRTPTFASRAHAPGQTPRRLLAPEAGDRPVAAGDAAPSWARPASSQRSGRPPAPGSARGQLALGAVLPEVSLGERPHRLDCGNRGQRSADGAGGQHDRAALSAALAARRPRSPPTVRESSRRQGPLSTSTPGPRKRSTPVVGAMAPPLRKTPATSTPRPGTPRHSAGRQGHKVGARMRAASAGGADHAPCLATQPVLRQSRRPWRSASIRVTRRPFTVAADVGGDQIRRRRPPITNFKVASKCLRPLARGGTDRQRCQAPARQLDDPGERAANRASEAASGGREDSVEAAQAAASWVPAFTYTIVREACRSGW